MGKKKKGVLSAQPAPKAGKAKRKSGAATKKKERIAKDERHARKMQHRMRDRRDRIRTPGIDAQPLPADLVAKGRLERPKVNSKYKTYLEFAENTEKKEKKLEFQVCISTLYVLFC